MATHSESTTRTRMMLRTVAPATLLQDSAERAALVAPEAPFLTELSNTGAPKQIHPVDDLGLVIGRGANADLRLDVEGVSRVHARVLMSSSGLVLEDCGSKNGTFFLGTRIRRRVLKQGDTFEVCGVTFKAGWR